MPADPAPKKRIRWSSRRVPAAFEEIFAALMKPERTTAPEMIGNETSLATSTNKLYLSLVSCNTRNVRNKINAKRTQGRLYIVIKDTVPGPEHVKISESIICRKIFELHEKLGKYFFH